MIMERLQRYHRKLSLFAEENPYLVITGFWFYLALFSWLAAYSFKLKVSFGGYVVPVYSYAALIFTVICGFMWYRRIQLVKEKDEDEKH